MKKFYVEWLPKKGLGQMVEIERKTKKRTIRSSRKIFEGGNMKNSEINLVIVNKLLENDYSIKKHRR